MELLAKHLQGVKNEKTDNVVPWNVVKSLYVINGKKLNDEELLYIVAVLKSKGLAELAANSSNEKVSGCAL